ncbi:MAG: hypothetical protein V2I43_12670 [Parvularcula sp.]|nr:hypothetical protein [Parvularcula sp.]
MPELVCERNFYGSEEEKELSPEWVQQWQQFKKRSDPEQVMEPLPNYSSFTRSFADAVELIREAAFYSQGLDKLDEIENAFIDLLVESISQNDLSGPVAYKGESVDHYLGAPYYDNNDCEDPKTPEEVVENLRKNLRRSIRSD